MRARGGWRILTLVAALVATACGDDDAQGAASERPAGADVYGNMGERMSREELERGRMDPSWRRVVRLDTTAAGDTTPNPESWDDISAQGANGPATHLPVHGDVAGPSVLRVQVLLDRVLFSPGIIDGRWGKNTEKAVYWFQEREGLPATGRVDEATFARLGEATGRPEEIVRTHTLTAAEVEGPFITIPDDIYRKAELDCMCYESLPEKLAELFHTSPELLEKLNPGVDLDGLSAGDRLEVPAIRDRQSARSLTAARIVVSDGGFYVHALDGQGRILFHFPTTLGSQYSPSPSGDYRVTAIAHDPTWHYQPELLEGIPDHEETAIIPAGPNNAVGVVWMQLSKPHYGIHGTDAPETIGYATSNGCVRLTNWDAEFLAERIQAGVPVEFRDLDNRGGVGDD
jgi:lipoprotein-anchoring transpeptidase ErfK/SrfK